MTTRSPDAESLCARARGLEIRDGRFSERLVRDSCQSPDPELRAEAGQEPSVQQPGYGPHALMTLRA